MSLPTASSSGGAVAGLPGDTASLGAPPSIADVETALAQARDLKAWWHRVEAGGEEIERFELYPATPGSEPVWGFYGEAPVRGTLLPVMGNVVDDFFDQPRVPPAQQAQAAAWMLAQVEEFALHYWLRASASALPEPYPELGHGAAAPYLSWISLCFPVDQDFSGSRYLQRLFRLQDDGRIGEFPPQARTAILDLRRLESMFDWITLDATDFDFNITVGGFGEDAPSLVLPLTINVHYVASADLSENQRDPDPSTLGAFGPGFGFLRAANPRVLAAAPDMIQPGLRLQTLRVLATGEVRSRSLLIMPRPEKILNLSVLAPDFFLGAADFLSLGATRSLTQQVQGAFDRSHLHNVGFDPLLASIRLLNLMTGGRAASELCISKEQVEKKILAKDALGARQGILSSRQIWLQVPDWLDRDAIPPWVIRGEIA